METLKLTEEDIERELQNLREPQLPSVIRIGAEDVASSPLTQVVAAAVEITKEDLDPVPPQASAPPHLAEMEQLMLNLIIEARRAQLPRWLGSPDLAWHDGLAAVARGHSLDMLQRQYVDHKSPEGSSASNRIAQAGIRFVACGENIGIIYGDASRSAEGIHEIHRAFMNQPFRLSNHRGNLLNPIWSHVGIGLAYKRNGALVATQNFISAPGAG